MSDPIRKMVRDALRDQAVQFGHVEGLVYRGGYDFLLQHGRWYTPTLAPTRFPSGHCYGGSLFFAGVNPGVRYVEGMALNPGGDALIPHAWVARGNRSYELTWGAVGLAYIGVEFSVGRADDATWNGDACVLDDFERGWPLFQQPWKGEDWQREWPPNERTRLIALVAEGKATYSDYLATMTVLEQEIAADG